MREREQSQLSQLQDKLSRINRAITKIDVVSQTIGTSAFNRRLNLCDLRGEAFLDAAVCVGKIKEALEERTRPTLLSKREETEREIENFAGRISKAKEDVAKIRQLVQKGLLSKKVLEKAYQELERIKSSIAPIETAPQSIQLKSEKVVKSERIERREVSLPDGYVVEIGGRYKPQLLERLVQSSEDNPAHIEELSNLLYGFTDQKYRTRVSANISILNIILRPTSYRIFKSFDSSHRAVYYLGKVVEE